MRIINNTTKTKEKPATGKAPPIPKLHNVTINLQGAKLRHDTMEGRPYLVVPMVMLTEGVHNGSQGPILYEKDDLEKTPETWNAKPITIYHPQMNGVGVSACDPIIFDKQKVGVIMGAKTTSTPKGVKLNAEAWLEAHRLDAVDNRILPKLEKGEMVELSTGLYADHEVTEGTWNGESYTAIARNYRPDHLAILPDQVGACSIKDGAGLLRNEASFESIRTLLGNALREEYGKDSYCYVMDVFKTFFVYEKESKLWKQQYTAADTKATLMGEALEVVKFVQYRSPDGAVIVNTNERKTNVLKSQMIIALLASGLFVESDKDFLEKQDEKRLNQLMESMPKPKQDPEKDEEKKPVKNVAAPIVTNTEEKPKKATVQDYISNAPPEIAHLLASGLRHAEQEKEKLIKTITGNSKNRFTPDQLGKKDLDELEAIAAFVTPTENAAALSHNYGGLADAYSAKGGNSNGVDLAPLELPSWAPTKK